MERLKVLFITAWYPTKDQPVAGTFVREHAKAVQLYDDVVVLHCAGVNPGLPTLWQLEQETDSNLTENLPTYRVLHRRSPLPHTSYPIYLWSILQAFRHLARQDFRPGIIHAHVYTAGVPAVLIGKLYRIPVVITEHSTVFPARQLSRLEILKARLAFEQANMVLPVSCSLQKAIKNYSIRGRFQVVPNVVDTTLFSPSLRQRHGHGPRRILFVGLLDMAHKKGIPCLFQALARLRQQQDGWRLDIVGDGPARGDYERMAVDLGLADWVTFHGLKSKREVAAFMQLSDIFVVPSLFETFSVVTAEALATGLPVLATHSGGPEELIVDSVGKLVPPGDADALYRGLQEMLDNLHLYSRYWISDYALKRFSPEQVGAMLHAVYESLKY